MTAALDIYDDALTGASTALAVRWGDGERLALPVARWLGPASPGERALLARAPGPVLDVGCGPGRLLHALEALGVEALGVDVSPAAVRLARRRGGRALHGSVFGAVPDAGRWGSVLLLDGNVGIGGDPVALLRRTAELLGAAGRVLVEVDPPGTATVCGAVRLVRRRFSSEAFPWARVGADGIAGLAREAGFAVHERWSAERRWFAELRLS